MCSLCSVLWTEDHWAEVGAEEAATDGNPTIDFESYASLRGRRLRDRAARIQVANLVLADCGLAVQDWEGSSYIVRDKKGNTGVVQDLASLWNAAEQILGRSLDPLDSAFLDRVQRRARA